MQNIFIELLPPWVETGLQPAFYDKESGTVLQQTARMYARVNQLTQAFNTFSEDTANTVNDYIDRFTVLYNYVHDYFDNLDVQEEVNNKIDELVEGGELQRILNSPATREALGGVIVGNGLDVTDTGVLSIKPYNFAVSKINGNMNNSIFPDVAKFGDKYYMVFRSGSLHASFDGKISFCYSEDGVNWSTPTDVLVEADVDYRDPFLSVVDNNLYLSTFTRVDNGDDTVTLTSYIYQFNPTTLATTLVKSIANEAIFGKIIEAGDFVVFGSYDDNASHIYRGNSIADATTIHSFGSGYELCIRYFDEKYYMLMRDATGVSLKESTNLTTWTDKTLPQMTSADSFTKVGDRYLIGFRDSIIGKHEYGNFAIAEFDGTFNLINTYKVFASQTQDCGYSAILFDEDNEKVIIATYLQDGSSKTSVYSINCNIHEIDSLNIFLAKFDLDNCLKPATLTNERDYASVIELINKETHGKFINMLDSSGTIKGQIYKDPNSALLYIENPTGGIFIKSSANTSMGVGTYNNIELQGTGNVLMRQGLEVRGTTNTQNIKVRALNNSSSPYVDVVKLSSGAYSSIPDIASVPTGYMYWDTGNARLLVNAGGAWKVITLTNP